MRGCSSGLLKTDWTEMVGIEIINASILIKAHPLQEIVIKIQEEAEA